MLLVLRPAVLLIRRAPPVKHRKGFFVAGLLQQARKLYGRVQQQTFGEEQRIIGQGCIAAVGWRKGGIMRYVVDISTMCAGIGVALLKGHPAVIGEYEIFVEVVARLKVFVGSGGVAAVILVIGQVVAIVFDFSAGFLHPCYYSVDTIDSAFVIALHIFHMGQGSHSIVAYMVVVAIYFCQSVAEQTQLPLHFAPGYYRVDGGFTQEQTVERKHGVGNLHRAYATAGKERNALRLHAAAKAAECFGKFFGQIEAPDFAGKFALICNHVFEGDCGELHHRQQSVGVIFVRPEQIEYFKIIIYGKVIAPLSVVYITQRHQGIAHEAALDSISPAIVYD